MSKGPCKNPKVSCKMLKGSCKNLKGLCKMPKGPCKNLKVSCKMLKGSCKLSKFPCRYLKGSCKTLTCFQQNAQTSFTSAYLMQAVFILLLKQRNLLRAKVSLPEICVAHTVACLYFVGNKAAPGF